LVDSGAVCGSTPRRTNTTESAEVAKVDELKLVVEGDRRDLLWGRFPFRFGVPDFERSRRVWSTHLDFLSGDAW
jgi:hypothetical protein